MTMVPGQVPVRTIPVTYAGPCRMNWTNPDKITTMGTCQG